MYLFACDKAMFKEDVTDRLNQAASLYSFQVVFKPVANTGDLVAYMATATTKKESK